MLINESILGTFTKAISPPSVIFSTSHNAIGLAKFLN